MVLDISKRECFFNMCQTAGICTVNFIDRFKNLSIGLFQNEFDIQSSDVSKWECDLLYLLINFHDCVSPCMRDSVINLYNEALSSLGLARRLSFDYDKYHISVGSDLFFTVESIDDIHDYGDSLGIDYEV